MAESPRPAPANRVAACGAAAKRAPPAGAAKAANSMTWNPIDEQVPAWIRGIQAYQPGRPIEEVERELGIHAVKLASNENPLGPSPMAVEAARRAMSDRTGIPTVRGTTCGGNSPSSWEWRWIG